MAKLFENIVKLTDYPFSYSLFGLLSIIFTHTKVDIFTFETNDFFPLLIIIGILGTALSITDPFGHSIRKGLKLWIPYESFFKTVNDYIQKIRESQIGKKFDHDYHIISSDDYFLIHNPIFNKYISLLRFKETISSHFNKVISTNWISYEIDKLVSIIYVFILIGLFLFVILYTNLYSNYTNSIDSFQNSTLQNVTNTLENVTSTLQKVISSTTIDSFQNSTLQNVTNTLENVTSTLQRVTSDPVSIFYNTLRSYIILFSILSFIGVGIIIAITIINLNKRTKFVNNYFIADEFVITMKEQNEQSKKDMINDYKNKLATYINNRDWGMAEYYSHKVEGEIIISLNDKVNLIMNENINEKKDKKIEE